MNNENNPQVVSVHLGSMTTDDVQAPCIHIPKKSKLISAKLMDRAGIAASDSAYISVTLKYGSTTLATFDSRAANQGALVANVSKAMLAALDEIPAGSDLVFDYQETGSVGMTDAKLVLEFYPL